MNNQMLCLTLLNISIKCFIFSFIFSTYDFLCFQVYKAKVQLIITKHSQIKSYHLVPESSQFWQMISINILQIQYKFKNNWTGKIRTCEGDAIKVTLGTFQLNLCGKRKQLSQRGKGGGREGNSGLVAGLLGFGDLEVVQVRTRRATSYSDVNCKYLLKTANKISNHR